MFRKELLLLGVIATLVFLTVAGASAWMTHILSYNARMLVMDTLPGLVNAGEALNVMDHNWQKIVGLTAVPSAVERSNVIQQISAHTAQQFWDGYEQSIFDPQDRELFASVQKARTQNRALVQKYFALVDEQRLEDARRLLEKDLAPAFADYRTATVRLFELNEGIGDQRSERILKVGHWLPLGAGLFSVLIFAVGFLLGLRGAFTGLEFAFSRKRV